MNLLSGTVFLCWGLFILEWLGQEEREGEILQTFPSWQVLKMWKEREERRGGSRNLACPPLPAADRETRRAGQWAAVGQALAWLWFGSSLCSSPSPLSQMHLRTLMKRAAGDSKKDVHVLWWAWQLGWEVFSLCSQPFVTWADEVSDFVLGVLDVIWFLLSLFFLVFLTARESKNEKGCSCCLRGCQSQPLLSRTAHLLHTPLKDVTEASWCLLLQPLCL